MPLLERRNPTDSFGSFARLKGVETFPNLTVAIGILVSIINARF
jgi:hypothetical protein